VTASAVEAGATIPAREFPVTRGDLVRYAGAAGDFNPIHWSDRVATAVGLPGVVAHGMLTMALGARLLGDWAGDPTAVEAYGVRFTRPVVVPDDDTGAIVTIGGRVTEVLDEQRVRVELNATCGEDRVLGQARATVRLGPHAPARTLDA
jgi:acyl dehydratase